MDISKWIELSDITDEDLRHCKLLGQKQKSIGLSVGGEYKGWRQNPNEVGKLCEYKYNQFLEQNKTPHVWRNILDGKGDAGVDFTINNKIIDVKGSENDRHPSKSPDTYTFQINKSQFDKHKYIDYYISIMFHENKIWFCGFISRTEVLAGILDERYPVVNPGHALCYSIPYLDLIDPHTFINIFKPKRITLEALYRKDKIDLVEEVVEETIKR